MNGKETYRVREGYTLRLIAEEYLAIPVSKEASDDGKIAILSDSGRFLWEAMQTEKNIDQLTAMLTQAYDVDEATARADIAAFIEHLKAYQLLYISGGTEE